MRRSRRCANPSEARGSSCTAGAPRARASAPWRGSCRSQPAALGVDVADHDDTPHTLGARGWPKLAARVAHDNHDTPTCSPARCRSRAVCGTSRTWCRRALRGLTPRSDDSCCKRAHHRLPACCADGHHGRRRTRLGVRDDRGGRPNGNACRRARVRPSRRAARGSWYSGCGRRHVLRRAPPGWSGRKRTRRLAPPEKRAVGDSQGTRCGHPRTAPSPPRLVRAWNGNRRRSSVPPAP